jgi:hypothetical protein
VDFDRVITLLQATASDGLVADEIKQRVTQRAAMIASMDELDNAVVLSAFAATHPTRKTLTSLGDANDQLTREATRSVLLTHIRGVLRGLAIADLAGA